MTETYLGNFSFSDELLDQDNEPFNFSISGTLTAALTISSGEITGTITASGPFSGTNVDGSPYSSTISDSEQVFGIVGASPGVIADFIAVWDGGDSVSFEFDGTLNGAQSEITGTLDFYETGVPEPSVTLSEVLPPPTISAAGHQAIQQLGVAADNGESALQQNDGKIALADSTIQNFENSLASLHQAQLATGLQELLQLVQLINGAVGDILALVPGEGGAEGLVAVLTDPKNWLDVAAGSKELWDAVREAMQDPTDNLALVKAGSAAYSLLFDLAGLAGEAAGSAVTSQLAGAMKLSGLSVELATFVADTQKTITDLNEISEQIATTEANLQKYQAIEQALSPANPAETNYQTYISNGTANVPLPAGTMDQTNKILQIEITNSVDGTSNWLIPSTGSATFELMHASGVVEHIASTGVSGTTTPVATMLDGSDYISLGYANQTLRVDSDVVGNLVVDGAGGSNGVVVFEGSYGSYQVTSTGNDAIAVENSGLTAIVEHVSKILFDNRSITFNASGSPTVAAVGTNPPGHSYVIQTGAQVLGNFNQSPFYDPLQGDKLELIGASVLPNATNFIEAPDIVSTYADAVTLANTLLQQYRYVAIAYDGGTPDSTGALQNGQNFLLLFVDTNGDHQANTILRLVGLDNVDELSTKDFALVSPVVNSVSSAPPGTMYRLGEQVVIDLQMNEGVTVTGYPVLKLNDGGTATYVSASSDPSAGELAFDYTVGAGQSTADLKISSMSVPSGSSVKDASGFNANFVGAVNADLQQIIDGIPPKVTEALLQDTGVSSTDKLTSNPELTGTGDPGATVDFTVNGHSEAATATADAKTGAWTFTPSSDLVQGSNTIVASETDAAGNTGTVPLTFTLDTVAPTVEGVTGTPASGSEIGLNGTAIIKLNMGEPLHLTGSPVLTLSDGETATYLAASSTLASGILAFSYKATANHNTSDLQISSVGLGTGVTDLAGNVAKFTLTTGQADLGLIVDTIPPTITTVASTTAANTKVPLGGNIVIDLTTSEAVSVTGAPTLTLSDGGVATYDAVHSNPASDKLEFDYATKTGQNTTDLQVKSLTFGTGVAIKDLAGNPIVATLPASADLKIAVDTDLPTVSTIAATPVSPATSTLKSGDVLAIKVTFTDATVGDTLTVTGTPALKLSDGGEATFASQVGGALTFTYTVGNESTTDLKVTGFDFTNGAIADSATNAPLTAITVATADLKDTVNVFTWGKAVSGDWNNNPTDWTPNGIPGAGNTALITATGTPYTVTSGQANSVAVLTMGTSATLAINASTFNVTGGTGVGALAGKINVGDGTTLGFGAASTSTTFNNTGSIALNSTGDATDLEIFGSVTLAGIGKVTLTDSSNENNNIVSNGATATLTNGNTTAGNTISGAGMIGDANLTLINAAKGSIVGNGIHNTLAISNLTNAGTVEGTTSQGVTLYGTNSNSGLLEALGPGALLDFFGSTVTNTTAGVILASGTGAVAHLEGGTKIIGGMLETAGTNAMIETGNTDTLDGSGVGNPVKNTGSLVVSDQTTLLLKGTINNTGAIAINSNDGDGATLEISGTVTLAGAGKVTLSDDSNNNIISDGAAATLTNGSATAGNTISGAGTIGDANLTLINQVKGIINGNGISNALTLSIGTNTITNAGTLEGTTAQGLLIQSAVANSNLIEALSTGTVTNGRVEIDGSVNNTTKGIILASGVGAHVDLNGADIVGGTLKSTGGSGATTAAIDVIGDSTLDGSQATNPVNNTATVNVSDGQSLTLLGTINDTGSIAVNSASSETDLVISSAMATLLGAGKIILAGADAQIVSDGNDTQLTDGNTSSGNTISGVGTIGDSHLSFVNGAKGIVNANDSAGGVLDINTHSFTNSGLVEATGHGVLDISSNITDTTTGLLKAAAAGAHVDLDGVTVTGGTVSTVAGSFLDGTSGSSTINTTAVLTNAGRLGAEGGDLTITGAVNNTGILDANGHHLSIGGAVSGTGTGTIENNGILEFAAASSAKITFVDGTGTLQLDAATTTAAKFTGTIANFGVGTDNIDLGAINYTTGNAQLTSFVENSAHTSGVLTVNDGTHTETLTFTGYYTLASFTTQQDINNHVDLLHV